MKNIVIIKEADNNKRIDLVASSFFLEISRSQWQKYGKFIRENKILNGKTKVKTGETWEIVFEKENICEKLKPWKHDLKIIKETSDYLVIDKPIEVSVHPSPSENSQKTIMNAVINYLGDKFAKKFKTENQIRPGLVHRLDKTTSGVLLIAKNDECLKFFQTNWKNVEKTYYAIVQGIPPKEGKITAGIFRDKIDRKKMSVSESDLAKDAITYFSREKISNDQKYSLLKINIPTGRTHQIRVHLSAIGFPIIGDEKYGGEKNSRIFLHSEKLKFLDFKTKKKIEVESKLPKDFNKFF